MYNYYDGEVASLYTWLVVTLLTKLSQLHLTGLSKAWWCVKLSMVAYSLNIPWILLRTKWDRLPAPVFGVSPKCEVAKRRR